MSVRLRLFALAMILQLAGPAAASDREPDWLALELSRYEAMVRADAGSLEHMLGGDLVFTHASGKIDTKASLLERLSTGSLVYHDIDVSDTVVQAFETCGVVTGRSSIEVSVAGRKMQLDVRFTSIWVRTANGYELVAYQSTRVS